MAYRPPSPDAFIEKSAREQTTGSEVFDEKVVEQWESVRPKEADFIGTYGFETVSKDRQYLSERERAWGAKPRSSMKLEYLMMDGIYSRNWLGDRTDVLPASKFDDVANGVDMVVRLEQEKGEPLFLAVDVTTSEDIRVLDQKIGRVAEGLHNGETARVKYFSSEQDGIHGALRLPKVVLGTDREETERLFSLFAKGLGEHQSMEAVDKEPIQVELITQMRRQLMFGVETLAETIIHTSQRIARRSHTPAPEFFPEFETALSTVRSLDLSTLDHSPRWEAFMKKLDVMRPVLEHDLEHLSRSLFQHVDLLTELDMRAKEKRSQGLAGRPALAMNRSVTEQMLEMRSKKQILDQQSMDY